VTRAIRRDREIERAELGICHQPERLDSSVRSEDDNRVVTLAIRADAGGKEQPPVTTERKSARKRHYSRAPRGFTFGRAARRRLRSRDSDAHGRKTSLAAAEQGSGYNLSASAYDTTTAVCS
jgi:hypothetical protein